jgi:hypothetical protein
MSVIAWIVIGLLAGWLATRIMGGRGGLMRNLAVVSWAPLSAGSCSKSRNHSFAKCLSEWKDLHICFPENRPWEPAGKRSRGVRFSGPAAREPR